MSEDVPDYHVPIENKFTLIGERVWKCEKHGMTQAVIRIQLDQVSVTYCEQCLLAALTGAMEVMGVKPLPDPE
jgi:hypothetical protein